MRWLRRAKSSISIYGATRSELIRWAYQLSLSRLPYTPPQQCNTGIALTPTSQQQRRLGTPIALTPTSQQQRRLGTPIAGGPGPPPQQSNTGIVLQYYVVVLLGAPDLHPN